MRAKLTTNNELIVNFYEKNISAADEALIDVRRKFAVMPDYLGKYSGVFCTKRLQKKNSQHLLGDFRSPARVIRSRGSPRCKRMTAKAVYNTTDARYLHNTSLFLLPHPHEQPHVNRFFFALPLAMLVAAFLFLSRRREK